jgi:hypothetical protein
MWNDPKGHDIVKLMDENNVEMNGSQRRWSGITLDLKKSNPDQSAVQAQTSLRHFI